jgi:phenylacetate-CoA ligase
MDREALTQLQLSRLRAGLAEILPRNAFYARKLGSSPPRVDSLADLTALPFTTKQELLEDQLAALPYGTNLTYPLEHYVRLHQTSGTKGPPLRWLDTPESWQWFMECWRQKYDMIGLRADDRLMFPFSFGPFIGFWAAFEAACKRGNLCLAGGGMSSVARLRFLLDHHATIICCTPTYGLRLLEVAKAESLDLASSPVRALIVAGEPGGNITSVRQRLEEGWGARVFDHTGMTEIGSLGMECVENPGSVHMLETECIPEVVDPASGRAVAAGIGGELVLTNLGRWGSPLIRYRTGDLVIADPHPCPCGRPFLRLKKGILGRTDDMIFIRGNNVYPSAIEDVLRRFPEIEEFRIEVDQRAALAELRIIIETQNSPVADAPGSSGRGEGLAERVRDAIKHAFQFRPDVTFVPPGTLPRSEMKSQRVVRKM